MNDFQALMMEPEGRRFYSIMKQRSLAMFGLVDIFVEYTLTSSCAYGGNSIVADEVCHVSSAPGVINPSLRALGFAFASPPSPIQRDILFLPEKPATLITLLGLRVSMRSDEHLLSGGSHTRLPLKHSVKNIILINYILMEEKHVSENQIFNKKTFDLRLSRKGQYP
ncbi:hypothetical protein EVAR_68054_1 [Eumeta japonica]|uniref:Uncharacterized protein n=1 Tax=Eumeta variegata TaxID=151549 RepID=A0A4C1ZNJ3_EUMVA|nr:hypothetical protein EVAR_68054_1 [Eumeta japonica]